MDAAALEDAPDPPGPYGHWLLGNYPQIKADMFGAFEQFRRTHGDVLQIRMIGGRRGYLLLHPAHVEHVLLRNVKNYPKWDKFMSATSHLLGRGLLTNDGELWKQERRYAQPTFTRQNINKLADIMASGANAVGERWVELARAGQPFDMLEEMTRLTMKIGGLALFSTDVSERTHELHQSIKITFDWIGGQIRGLFPLPPNLPTAHNREFARHAATLHSLADEVIRLRRAISESDWPDDLLSSLLRVRDVRTGEPIPEWLLHDEVMTLFVTGHETTASTLAWTWYLLGTNPEVEARLHEELDSVLGGRLPTLADVKALQYTRQVVEETMRLYPSVWGISRMSIADDVIAGYRIRGNSRVALSTYVTHRHPDFWQQPNEFFPDHFSPDRVAARPRFAYFPFGAGIRQCIGNHFALMEGQLALATLAQRFSARPVEGLSPKLQLLFTMRPRHGLSMLLSERASSVRP